MIEHDAAEDIWERYRRGERNVFTRRLYTLQGQQTFEEIRRRYRRDDAFRDTVNRYIDEFERLIGEVDREDQSGTMARTYLTADSGKVYTILAHAGRQAGVRRRVSIVAAAHSQRAPVAAPLDDAGAQGPRRSSPRPWLEPRRSWRYHDDPHRADRIPGPADLAVIGNGLDAFDDAVSGPSMKTILVVLVRDEAGSVVGGLWLHRLGLALHRLALVGRAAYAARPGAPSSRHCRGGGAHVGAAMAPISIPSTRWRSTSLARVAMPCSAPCPTFHRAAAASS